MGGSDVIKLRALKGKSSTAQTGQNMGGSGKRGQQLETCSRKVESAVGVLQKKKGTGGSQGGGCNEKMAERRLNAATVRTPSLPLQVLGRQPQEQKGATSLP